MVKEKLRRTKWLIWGQIALWIPRIIWLIKGRFLIGVIALIFNRQKKILLVQHQWSEKYLWRLPGGLVEKRGSLKENLAREIKEELGVEAKYIQLFWVEKSPWQLRIDIFFLFVPQTKVSNLPPKSEVKNFCFFPLNHLPKNLFPGQKKVIFSAWKQLQENRSLWNRILG